MKDEIKPFESVTRCPKCGQEWAHLGLRPKAVYHPASGFDVPEHLEYQCKCGAKWREHTLDHKEADEEQDDWQPKEGDRVIHKSAGCSKDPYEELVGTVIGILDEHRLRILYDDGERLDIPKKCLRKETSDDRLKRAQQLQSQLKPGDWVRIAPNPVTYNGELCDDEINYAGETFLVSDLCKLGRCIKLKVPEWTTRHIHLWNVIPCNPPERAKLEDLTEVCGELVNEYEKGTAKSFMAVMDRMKYIVKGEDQE